MSKVEPHFICNCPQGKIFLCGTRCPDCSSYMPYRSEIRSARSSKLSTDRLAPKRRKTYNVE